MDPDPGLRLLVQFLSTYDVAVIDARRTRYWERSERLGYGLDHVDDRSYVGSPGVTPAWIQDNFQSIYVR
ncbi:hypothetical protein [Streptomyces sp. NPDC005828]|uniref:hypothetical protein n=1 Tax=Streptomyces sp. NPDC005828 TaxID=3157071 RepID=UPI00340EF0B8